MKIALADLLANPANAGRVRLADKQTVQRYVRMAAQTAPPPITIDKSGFILDGLHRVAAALEMGRADIETTDPLETLRASAHEWQRERDGWYAKTSAGQGGRNL